jgi:hypothetical protein
MPSAGQLVATQQRSKPQFAADDSAALHTIENGQSPGLRQPTAKELAAAKAARIRLGYEQADGDAAADALVRKAALDFVHCLCFCALFYSRGHVKPTFFCRLQAAPKLPDGPEPPRPEHVDYVSLEDAKPCEDIDGCLSVRPLAMARFFLCCCFQVLSTLWPATTLLAVVLLW